MAEQTEPAAPMTTADPRHREEIHVVFVIGTDRTVDVRDTDALGLGDDHGKWMAFIREAIGSVDEAVMQHPQAGYAYYLNADAYHRQAPEDFNAIATMLGAADLGIELEQAPRMYGTVVMARLDPETFHPRPFDGAAMLAHLDALLGAEFPASEQPGEHRP